MWSFDKDKYMSEILVPAHDEFIKNGELPDAFQRYNLPLEISDINTIQKAVKEVTSFWNVTIISNPKFKNILEVLRDENKKGEITKDLIDEESRKNLRGAVKEERRKKAEKKFAALDTYIKQAASKGYITPQEKNTLISRFKATGLDENEIISRIKVPIDEVKVSQPADGFEPTIRKNIRNNLAVFKKRTLYDFLEVTSKPSKAELEKKHQELTSIWKLKKGDINKTAAEALLSIVKTRLIKDGLEKYEQSLVWDAIDDELGPRVEFAATDGKISSEEYESLIDFGVKYGLSKEQTIEAVLWLAQKKGAIVERSEQTDRVICGNCRALAPKSSNKCTSCGDDLWTVCRKCTVKVAISDEACGSCGFVAANLYKVNLFVRKAQIALNEKNLEDALKFAREAESIWERQGNVAILLDNIESRIKQAELHRREYDEALNRRRLFAARSSLAMLAGISQTFKGWDKKTPAELQRELEVQIVKVEKLLEQARRFESDKNINDAVRSYQEVLGIAADAEEAEKGLKRCPPEPPNEVSLRVFDGKIVVEWKESPAVGNLEYLVVRCDNRAPVNPQDGTVVAKVSHHSFCDEKAHPSSFVYYGIFTERGGVHSRPAISNGVLAIKEVEDFSLEVGEGLVRGSWKFDVPEGKVRVFCGSESELRQGKGRPIQLTNPQTFEDTNLKNGETYNYRILVEYRDLSGKVLATAGKFASATPVSPPQPVHRFDITSDAGNLNFQWTPPPFGTVSIYRLTEKPTWRCGTQIPLANLTKFGMPLRNVRAGLAVDSFPTAGQVYYTPFTIAGDAVVVGEAKPFISAEEITGLRVEDFESYLQLRWKWSPHFHSVVVAWRHDDYPNDAQDAKAIKQIVTKGEYDANGGFKIKNPKKMPYKFVVYTVNELDGQPVYSVGLNQDCRAEARVKQAVKISYSLKTKGWWRKSFVLSLDSEQPISALPELVVVAKPGETQPLDSEDGKIVARLNNISLESSFEHEFEAANIKRPFFISLFFAQPNSYNSFKLSAASLKQLKVR